MNITLKDGQIVGVKSTRGRENSVSIDLCPWAKEWIYVRHKKYLTLYHDLSSIRVFT